MQSPPSSIGNAKVAENLMEFTFGIRNDKSMAKYVRTLGDSGDL